MAQVVPEEPMAVVRTNIFVGRERELGDLIGALEDATSGRGRLVLLSGDPGIGKSHLADELAAEARRRGARALWGRCWEAGGAPAYWPWVQSIRSLVRDLDPETLKGLLGTGAPEVAQMLPEVREVLSNVGQVPSTDPETLRFRLFDAATTFLIRAAELDPLVLILDDLHVTDIPSLLLLRFLASELGDSRVLVVAIYRDSQLLPEHPLTAAVTELMRQRVTRRISLAGLSRDEVTEFVAAATGLAPSTELATTVHTATEGNPLFVGEVVRLLVAEGRLERRAGEGFLGLRIPRELKAVIARRLEGLSGETRHILSVASVLGREFDIEALLQLTAFSEERLTDHLEEAGSARVIVDVPGTLGRLRFSHALVRDALYDDLSATTRMQLHRRAGEALESLHEGNVDPHLAELAQHFLVAAPGGDVGKAVAYARKAGDRAMVLVAYEEAVRLYEMALTALGFGRSPDPAIRCELLLLLGDAQARAGSYPSAKSTFLEAAKLARKHGLSERLARAALGYGGRFIWEAGRDDPLVGSLLEEALAALGDAENDLRVKVMARLAAGPLRDQPDRERRDALSSQAVEMARRFGDRATLAYALVCRNAAALWPENVKERLATGDELVLLAQRIGDPEREHQGRTWRSFARWEVGDMAGVYEDLEAQMRLEGVLRQPAQRWLGLTSRAVLANFEGRFADAEELASEAVEVGRTAAGPMVAVYEAEQLWALRREQDRLDEVVDDLRRLSLRFPMYPVLRCELAHAYAELGRELEARVEFEALSADDFSLVPRTDTWIFGLCLLAEVAEYLQQPVPASRIYELLLPFHARVATFPVEASLGAVARTLGILASMLARWEEAETQFREALETNIRVGARPWVARTHFDHGRMLLTRGDRARAPESLSHSLAICRELGMHALERRVRALRVTESPRSQDAVEEPGGPGREDAVFRREGEYWLIAFAGESFHLRGRKGLLYLSRLLAQPGREIHVLELAGAAQAGMRAAGSIDVMEILDPQAKAAYRRRLEDLEEVIAEAHSFGDDERAARAQEERELLAHELSAAFGLGGRTRRTGSAGERARVAVTQAIRTAMAKIREQSRPLGEHLDRTISTGVFCCYAPDPRIPIDWQL